HISIIAPRSLTIRFFFLTTPRPPRSTLFPTRRSSDLDKTLRRKIKVAILAQRIERLYSKDEILEFYLNKAYFGDGLYGAEAASRDRKSTRLNSSHVAISYAVFCLKKKKKRWYGAG